MICHTRKLRKGIYELTLLLPKSIAVIQSRNGGIDQRDQLIIQCNEAIKKFFFYFIDMCVLNTYYIQHAEWNKDNRSVNIIKQALVEEIFHVNLLPVRRELTTSPAPLHLQGCHFPDKFLLQLQKDAK